MTTADVVMTSGASSVAMQCHLRSRTAATFRRRITRCVSLACPTLSERVCRFGLVEFSFFIAMVTGSSLGVWAGVR